MENLLQQQPTPFLWCRLAELQDNVAYFESSWELSNHHYARAQRGLGKHYFYYKEYEECIKHYELAVCVLSNETMTSWISTNCILIFGLIRVLLIWFWRIWIWLLSVSLVSFRCSLIMVWSSFLTDGVGQAWCNLAGILYNQKKYQEAFQSITIASQYLDDRWKVWDNMITISVYCIHTLW